MRNLVIVLLIACPFISKGQNLQVAFGTSISSLDWQYRYLWGGVEEFYTAPLLGLAADIGVEYLKRDCFSLNSSLGYFQSGGKIAQDEEHDNWKINETKNSASNVFLGTNLNVIPIDKRIQLMVSVGPRIDYLIPATNSAMDYQDDIRKIHFGLTGGLSLYYKFEKMKIGLRGNILHRFTRLLDTEPNNGNWWENPTLGVKSKDRLIVNSQLVFAIKL